MTWGIAFAACVHPVNACLLCWRKARVRRQQGWSAAARSLCAVGLLSFNFSQGPADS